MKKSDYLATKRYIKCLCLDEIKELSKKVGLTEYEYQLLYWLNQDAGRISTSLLLGICESKYTKDMKKAIEKTFRYLKRTNQIG